jgi:raw score 11.15
MAGYQEEGDDPVSILFTRAAGENAAVEGKFTILPFGEADRDVQVGQDIEIWLNGKSLGKVKHISDDAPDKLTEEQTKALLSRLKKESEIRLAYGKTTLKVSDKGAAAAMLKMDEFQQRLNTPSALIRQGQEKHAVLAPQPAPKIEVVSVNNRKTTELKRGEKQYNNVLALLRKAHDGCVDEDLESQYITIYPLTHNKVLAEALCFKGAYQSTNYYAVLDDKLSKVEQVLADQYNEAGYDEKQGYAFVRGTYKARGIGDCWSGDDAVWNGKIFIRTSEWTTGSCKGFTGGAWQLPTFVSDIIVK